MSTSPSRRVSRALVPLLVLTGCASTTYDPSVTTPATVEVATTLPSGTAAELLPRLLDEAGKLSDAIGTNTGKGEQIDKVNAIWDAVRPEIADTDGVVVLTFDGMIELCRRAEKFNRPADADKCTRNLRDLVDAYLADHPG